MAVSLAQWPPSQGGHNLQRRQIGLVLIFAQIGSFLCDDYPAPITQVFICMFSNICDSIESVDFQWCLICVSDSDKTTDYTFPQRAFVTLSFCHFVILSL